MRIRSFLGSLKRLVRRVVHDVFPGRNKAHTAEYWAALENHSEHWDKRTKLLVELVGDDTSVFEFGAGRSVFMSCAKPGIRYGHHDLVARNRDTQVFDLNIRPLPVIQGYQTAVFSGVLEYVVDLESFFNWLAEYFQIVVCSYATRERTGTLRERHAAGWQNHLKENDLMALLNQIGFQCVQKAYYQHDQVLFRFEKYAQ